jgi:hypothetical protein
MKVHRLIMMPDGRPHHQERVETDDLAPEMLEPFAGHFNGLRCDAVIPTDHGGLKVLWNGMEQGAALGTFWLDGQMFLCTVFAAGLDPEADTQLLTMAGRQWAGTDLVRGLMEGAPSPFASLDAIPERPLLTGMLIPMLSIETYREIAGVDLILTALFLERLRLSRGA